MEAHARARVEQSAAALERLANLKDLIREDLQLVEERIVESLDSEITIVEQISQHLLKQKSKRFRPVVLLLCARSRDFMDESVIHAATAVELVHTATLIHDDIIDGSQTRRGLPTVNALWGDPTSVIMGDFLYSKGLDLMAEIDLPQVSMILARVTHRMSRGEMLQLEGRGNLDFSEDRYLTMIREKTASLIGASCQIGAFLSSKADDKQENFKRFGERIGFAFQVTDDLQDFLSTEEELGKPVGFDLMNGRVTLPFIVSYRNAPDKHRREISELLDFRNYTQNKSAWKSISSFVQNYGGIEYSRDLALGFGAKAKKDIGFLPDSRAKESLMFAVDYVTMRAS